MIPFGSGETVVRVRAARVPDRYNPDDVVLDWDDADETDIDGCGVAMTTSVEPLLDAREAVDSDFTLFLPTGTDLTPHDRVVVRGLVCDVAGRPFDWRNPFTGWAPGMVAQAKVREG